MMHHYQCKNPYYRRVNPIPRVSMPESCLLYEEAGSTGLSVSMFEEGTVYHAVGYRLMNIL